MPTKKYLEKEIERLNSLMSGKLTEQELLYRHHDMATDPDLSRSVKWTGRYKGICYQIFCWDLDKIDDYGRPCPIWNYYLRFNEKQIPEDLIPVFFPEIKEFNNFKFYVTDPFFDDFEWHGGVSFMNIETYMGSRISVIGCDYNHLSDDGMRHIYDLSYVKTDAKNTIDKLLEKRPDIRNSGVK
jgi:hypothetical protein